jgi:hypothetical protein
MVLVTGFLSHAQVSDAKLDSMQNVMSIPNCDEREASYPGGQPAWLRYVVNKIRLPNNINTIISLAKLRFQVTESGVVRRIKMVEGDPAVRKMFVRIVRQSGKWLPAMRDGRAVKSYTTIQVRYCLLGGFDESVKTE